MSDNGIEITTPVGRIVWGHPTKAKQKVDQDTNQPLFKDGQPVMEWSFGLAIPTADFEAYVWPYMHQEALKGYPSGQFPPKFSWKMTNGDRDIDLKGIPYSQREGHAGHIILAVNTVFQAPGIFKSEAGVFRQMAGDEIKCGDYVRCGINFKVNVPAKATHTPSLYVNPLAIEFIGYGVEIKTGYVADPKALFAQPAAMPAGASATPIGGTPAAQMPGMGGMPGGTVAPPPVMAPPPPVAPPVAPPAGPQRPTDPTHIHAPGTAQEQWYINGAWTPAPAPAMAPPPPPAVPGALPPPAAGFASPGGMPAAPMPGQMPGR